LLGAAVIGLSTLAVRAGDMPIAGLPEQPALALWRLTDVAEPSGRAAAPPVVRAHTIEIDRRALSGVEQRDVIALPLPGDRTVTGRVDRLERRGTRLTVGGPIVGAGPGSFTIVSHDGAEAGVVRDGRRLYRLRADSGCGEIEEIDGRRFPPCLAAAAPKDAGSSPGGLEGPACDDGSTIDVLILYTPIARDEAGGRSQVEAEIALAVEVANSAYTDSDSAPRLRLVHVRETPYDEPGFYPEHLLRLINPGDGFLDEAHDLRDTYGADIVTLIVADTFACGAARLMTVLSPSFESQAFNVVTLICAAANFSYAHEVGHTSGCQHDREAAGSQGGVFEYSYGFRFVGDTGEWRSVLGIGPGTRVGRFSNPDVLFDGVPTGLPEGDPASADNARTLDESALTVANFRCSTLFAPTTFNVVLGDHEAGDVDDLAASDDTYVEVDPTGDRVHRRDGQCLRADGDDRDGLDRDPHAAAAAAVALRLRRGLVGDRRRACLHGRRQCRRGRDHDRSRAVRGSRHRRPGHAHRLVRSGRGAVRGVGDPHRSGHVAGGAVKAGCHALPQSMRP
jgi:hypothetical protein